MPTSEWPILRLIAFEAKYRELRSDGFSQVEAAKRAKAWAIEVENAARGLSILEIEVDELPGRESKSP